MERSVRGWGVHVLVVVALAAAATTVVGLVESAGAAGTTVSAFVPITPCRLADTRVKTNVGLRVTPIGPGEIATFQVTGINGNCTIPVFATGIASNVTFDNPTAPSYLTVFPADVPQPLASNLNWTAASSPTPNQVTVQLSTTGAIKAFNNGGTIDVIIDIVGYYQPASAGVPGVPGVPGAKGDPGVKGDPGADGSARAYGFVNGTTVTRSKNVVKVTNPQAGVLCVTLDPSISLATVVPTASPDFQNDDTASASGTMTYVEPRSSPLACPVTALEFDSGFTVGTTGMDKNEPFWFTVN